MVPAAKTGINSSVGYGTIAPPLDLNVSAPRAYPDTIFRPYMAPIAHQRHEFESPHPIASSVLWPLQVLVPKARAAGPQGPIVAKATDLEAREGAVDPSSLTATWERAQNDPAVAGNIAFTGVLIAYGLWRATNVARLPVPKSAPMTIYPDYRVERDAMIMQLKQQELAPNLKKNLARKLARNIFEQSVVYLDDLAKAKAHGDKDQMRLIIKSFSQDFTLLTGLLDQWHIRTDDDFRDIYADIEARFCNAENSPFKRLPMFWLNNLNTFAVYVAYLMLLTAFDAAAAPVLQHILPSLFDSQPVDWSCWQLGPFQEKLEALFKFNFAYNFLFYSGVDGLKSKNTNGVLSRLNNTAIDGLSMLGYPVLKPVQVLLSGADRLAQSAIGARWEGLSTFAWQFSRSGVFSANGYLKRTLGPVAQWVGLGMEIAIASLGNVGNAVMLDPEKASLSFAEKFADAYENFWPIMNEKTLPALWQNLLRTFGFVYISQHPRNDPATAQGIRFLYGVPSGGAYLLATTARNIKESSLTQSMGLTLGVLGLEYSLAVCSNWLRDATGPRDAASRFVALAKDTVLGKLGRGKKIVVKTE